MESAPQRKARQWVSEHLTAAGSHPFSFNYGDAEFRDLAGSWGFGITAAKTADGKKSYAVIYSDPKTKLEVRCEITEYADYPAVEWTVHFKNGSRTESPVIDSILNLDLDYAYEESNAAEYVLHRNLGTRVKKDDFRPIDEVLERRSAKTMSGCAGKPSLQELPYFNIRKGDEGMIAAVGWPGQWKAEFVRDREQSLRIRCGMERTHFKLFPGEEVRTPRMLILFWEGDRADSQNTFRHWMTDHNVPRAEDGKPFRPQIFACSSHLYNEMIEGTEENQIACIDAYHREGIAPDYWWMDAGWYYNSGVWSNTGTWEVDRNRFPRGFRPISDDAHSKGIKIIVWFEPERVSRNTWLYTERPQWLLPGPVGNDRLLDLGNPEALEWAIEHFDQLMKDEGIDMYRQDFNTNPLPFWQAHDAEDRQGITEIRYLTGYLAYWDELRRRHPGMVIDNCAGGGTRLDIESLKRSVPLLRSDYIFEPEGEQGALYGLSEWIPYHGTGVMQGHSVTMRTDWPLNEYLFRSVMSPNIICCWDPNGKDTDFPLIRRMFAELRRISKYYYADFYGLSDYSVETSAWMVWQYNDPTSNEGVVQAFRHAGSPYSDATFRFKGLKAAEIYELTYSGTKRKPLRMTGEVLMTDGLKLHFNKAPDSAVLFYSLTGRHVK